MPKKRTTKKGGAIGMEITEIKKKKDKKDKKESNQSKENLLKKLQGNKLPGGEASEKKQYLSNTLEILRKKIIEKYNKLSIDDKIKYWQLNKLSKVVLIDKLPKKLGNDYKALTKIKRTMGDYKFFYTFSLIDDKPMRDLVNKEIKEIKESPFNKATTIMVSNQIIFREKSGNKYLDDIEPGLNKKLIEKYKIEKKEYEIEQRKEKKEEKIKLFYDNYAYKKEGNKVRWYNKKTGKELDDYTIVNTRDVDAKEMDVNINDKRAVELKNNQKKDEPKEEPKEEAKPKTKKELIDYIKNIDIKVAYDKQSKLTKNGR